MTGSRRAEHSPPTRSADGSRRRTLSRAMPSFVKCTSCSRRINLEMGQAVCPWCGAPAPVDTAPCRACGEPVVMHAAACPHCGTDSPTRTQEPTAEADRPEGGADAAPQRAGERESERSEPGPAAPREEPAPEGRPDPDPTPHPEPVAPTADRRTAAAVVSALLAVVSLALLVVALGGEGTGRVIGAILGLAGVGIFAGIAVRSGRG